MAYPTIDGLLTRLTPGQRDFYDLMPAVCKQSAEQREAITEWIFYNPTLVLSLPSDADPSSESQQSIASETLYLLRQVNSQYPALKERIEQVNDLLIRTAASPVLTLEPHDLKAVTGLQTQLEHHLSTILPNKLASQLTTNLDLAGQAREAFHQALDQTTVNGLNAMIDGVHRRIDQAASPALVTQSHFRGLLWGMWAAIIVCSVLTAGWILAQYRAHYFSQGFYKYELVRYRALLPGHRLYRNVFDEVEGDFEQPGFLDKIAGLEALYGRLGTTATIPDQTKKALVNKEAKSVRSPKNTAHH